MKQKKINLSYLGRLQFIFLLSLLLVFSADAQQRKMDISGKINPNLSCSGNDLCVNWTKDATARAEYRSEFFYIVVLKTTEKCDASEKERLELQKLFPKNKVFLEENGCSGDEEKRTLYEGIGDDDHSFIAVSAGKTKTEAEKFLQIVKAAKTFPGANVRRTQVVVVGT
jgi:hypothetical protein